jgi:regulatory protein
MTGSPRSSADRRAAADARRERRASVTDAAIVMEAAAQLLAVRSRSVAETRSRLRHLGYPEPLIEEVLTRLLAMGYLDDVAFGRAWVESRDRSRPRGETALRQELRRKGLDEAVVREVLADRAAGVSEGRLGEAGPEIVTPTIDEDPRFVDRAAAERLLARKASALAREPDPRKRRQKAYALLARNGFDPGVCQAVSRMVTDGYGTDPDDVTGDPDALGSGED